jgi:hypothetical protein
MGETPKEEPAEFPQALLSFETLLVALVSGREYSEHADRILEAVGSECPQIG